MKIMKNGLKSGKQEDPTLLEEQQKPAHTCVQALPSGMG